jgi:hypothetical protein
MRFSTVAAAVCLSLLPLAGGFAATPPQTRGDAQGTGTPAPAGPAPATAVPAAAKSASVTAATPSGDAAAKHAKRTACLKDAKAKKLVGAEKTEFLKNCIAAP